MSNWLEIQLNNKVNMNILGRGNVHCSCLKPADMRENVWADLARPPRLCTTLIGQPASLATNARVCPKYWLTANHALTCTTTKGVICKWVKSRAGDTWVEKMKTHTYTMCYSGYIMRFFFCLKTSCSSTSKFMIFQNGSSMGDNPKENSRWRERWQVKKTTMADETNNITQQLVYNRWW